MINKLNNYNYKKDCEEFEKNNPDKSKWKPIIDLPNWMKNVKKKD